MRAPDIGEGNQGLLDDLERKRTRRRAHFVLGAILSTYILLYARAASFAFVWDDLPAVIQNPLYAGSWSAGLAATQHDHLDLAQRRLGEARPAHDSYRPALYLSHRSERALYGTSAAGHHIHNIVLGALAIALVFMLARTWLDDLTKALAVTGVFALHPVQVEPLVYVSGRGDLLSAIFGIISLLTALRGANYAGQRMRRVPWLLASTSALVLALLSKEAYIGLPAALLLIAWSQNRLRRHVADVCAHAIGLALYLALRLSMARVTGGHSGLDGALLLPGLWLQYLRITLIPSDLSITRPFATSLHVAGWVALLPVAALFITASRKPFAGSWVLVRQALAGAVFALVLVGPSAIVVNIMGVVADRYVYLPLVGFAVAFVSCGQLITIQAPNTARLLHFGAGALALVWLAITSVQIPVWRNPKSLYEQAYAVEPESSLAAYGLGLAHAEAGEWPLAEPLFARATELDPKNARAWNNLAVCALKRGDYPRALEVSEHALSVSPVPFRALYNLASAHLQLGHRDQACKALQRSLAINSGYRQARELMTYACAPKHEP